MSRFEHQAAGHQQLLKVDHFVAKPLNLKEFHFYKQINELNLPITSYVPTFFGTRTISPLGGIVIKHIYGTTPFFTSIP
jgi:hypothetical protein